MAVLTLAMPHPTTKNVGDWCLVLSPDACNTRSFRAYGLSGFDQVSGVCHFGQMAVLDEHCYVLPYQGLDPVRFLNAVERGLSPRSHEENKLVVRAGFYGGFVVDEAGKPRIEKHSLGGAYLSWLGRERLR